MENHRRLSTRFTWQLSERLLEYQRSHPHMSLNSIVAEAVDRFLKKKERKGKGEGEGV